MAKNVEGAIFSDRHGKQFVLGKGTKGNLRPFAAGSAAGTASTVAVLAGIPVWGWIALGVVAVGAVGIGIYAACNSDE
jgi:hypothetical protein